MRYSQNVLILPPCVPQHSYHIPTCDISCLNLTSLIQVANPTVANGNEHKAMINGQLLHIQNDGYVSRLTDASKSCACLGPFPRHTNPTRVKIGWLLSNRMITGFSGHRNLVASSLSCSLDQKPKRLCISQQVGPLFERG
jgi:hypothetical protein